MELDPAFDFLLATDGGVRSHFKVGGFVKRAGDVNKVENGLREPAKEKGEEETGEQAREQLSRGELVPGG